MQQILLLMVIFLIHLNLTLTSTFLIFLILKLGMANINSKRSKKVESATLAKNCYIDLGKAKTTVIRTTQRGFWSFLHLTMGRLYPTNEK